MVLFRLLYLSLPALLLTAAVAFAADEPPRLRPDAWATPILSSEFDNWYKVDDLVYRSEQPDADGMRELSRLGIKRVLNLRNFHSDDDELEESGIDMTLYRVDMQAENITDDEVIAALRAIQAAETPIVVHCWHGSDRTGTVIAMYRIIVQGWSREAALDELINGNYGYHSLYKSIPKYIMSVDLDLIRDGLNRP